MTMTNTNGNNCGDSIFTWLMFGVLFSVALISVILILRDNHEYFADHLNGDGVSNAIQAEAANPAAEQAADTFKAGADHVYDLVENHVPYVTAGMATTGGIWFASKMQSGSRTAMMSVAFGLLALAAIFYGVMKALMFSSDVTGIRDALLTHANVLKVVPWALVSAAIGVPVLYGTCHLIGMGCGGSSEPDEPQVVYMTIRAAAGASAAAAPKAGRRLFIDDSPAIGTLVLLISVVATIIFLSWRYSSLFGTKPCAARNQYVVKKPASYPLGQRAATSPRVVIEY